MPPPQLCHSQSKTNPRSGRRLEGICGSRPRFRSPTPGTVRASGRGCGLDQYNQRTVVGAERRTRLWGAPDGVKNTPRARRCATTRKLEDWIVAWSARQLRAPRFRPLTARDPEARCRVYGRDPDRYNPRTVGSAKWRARLWVTPDVANTPEDSRVCPQCESRRTG